MLIWKSRRQKEFLCPSYLTRGQELNQNSALEFTTLSRFFICAVQGHDTEAFKGIARMEMNKMNPLLKKTLETIKIEDEDFKDSFDLVDEIVEQYGEDNLAIRLYNDIDETIDWKLIADLFCILVWSTNDNGHALTRETDRWLVEAVDIRKIKIALNLDVFPFIERSRMEDVLPHVAKKYPEVSERCLELIEKRRKLDDE